MTRQTAQPLEEFRKDTRHSTMRELVRMIKDGHLTLDAPYQRGAVWTVDQQVGLVRSWMTGIPIPAIITSDRTSPWWTGPKPAGDGRGAPLVAVIDGKQRILTGLAWFSNELAVPASWFPSDEVVEVEETVFDGPYVRYGGLTKGMRTHTAFTWTVPVVEARVADVRAEAEVYLLVNGAGVPQTAADMDNAVRVARG